MKTLIILSIFYFSLFLIIRTLLFFHRRSEEDVKMCPYLKIKTLKTSYYMTPERWEFFYGYKGKFTTCAVYIPKKHYERIKLQVRYLDYIFFRYFFVKKSFEKEKTKEVVREKNEIFIKCLQNDIDDYREDIRREIEESKKIVDELPLIRTK